MTTPAVDLRARQIITASRYQTRNCHDPSLELEDSNEVVSHEIRKWRLASTNNPKDIRGWRDPAPWYSYGYNHNPVPGGTMEITSLHACGDDTRLYTILEDGYGTNPNQSDLPDVPSSMVDRANSKALLKLKDQKVNLGVAMAELHETADLVSTACSRIASGVRAYRKRHNTSIWNQIKQEGQKNGKHHYYAIPGDWLELQYGWNPLMQDIQGACEALSKRTRDSKSFDVKVTGACKDTYKRKWVKAMYAGFGHYRCTDFVQFNSRTVLYYSLNNPLLATFSSLGLTNPAEIVWERIPYSFVVDWFLPVGSWLSSMDADFGWSFKAGANTCFTKVTGNGSALPDNPDPNNFDVVVGNGDYNYKGWVLNRLVFGSTPGVGLPHFKNPFSAHHVANAISLLVQAFR